MSDRVRFEPNIEQTTIWKMPLILDKRGTTRHPSLDAENCSDLDRGKNVTKSINSKRRSSRLQPQAGKTSCDIDIRPLKAFVSANFPKNWPLREAILAERDVLNAQEVVAKIETWLNLLRLF